jgi:dihydrofolate reductase
MRNLVYFVATTIDGYITTASDVDPDFLLYDGPQVADLLQEFPETIPGHLRSLLGVPNEIPNQRFDTVLMGRATYDIGRAIGVTSPYPHLRQIVVSSSLGPSPDPAVEIISSDVVSQVQEIKRSNGKDIWICGGGNLAASLINEIDEFIFKISPVVLGGGVSVFGEVVGPRQLTMTNHRVYENGFALLRYRPVAG